MSNQHIFNRLHTLPSDLQQQVYQHLSTRNLAKLRKSSKSGNILLKEEQYRRLLPKVQNLKLFDVLAACMQSLDQRQIQADNSKQWTRDITLTFKRHKMVSDKDVKYINNAPDKKSKKNDVVVRLWSPSRFGVNPDLPEMPFIFPLNYGKNTFSWYMTLGTKAHNTSFVFGIKQTEKLDNPKNDFPGRLPTASEMKDAIQKVINAKIADGPQDSETQQKKIDQQKTIRSTGLSAIFGITQKFEKYQYAIRQAYDSDKHINKDFHINMVYKGYGSYIMPGVNYRFTLYNDTLSRSITYNYLAGHFLTIQRNMNEPDEHGIVDIYVPAFLRKNDRFIKNRSLQLLLSLENVVSPNEFADPRTRLNTNKENNKIEYKNAMSVLTSFGLSHLISLHDELRRKFGYTAEIHWIDQNHNNV